MKINATIIKELAIAGIKTIDRPEQIKKLSLDYYYFSPILAEKLKDKRAELVVQPANEAEVLKVAKICVQHKIPLTVRGAGTGNYGQCIPLNGGIVMDMSAMNQILWLDSGVACVQPGIKLSAIEKESKKQGWELRMIPSTYKTATLGGFLAGGSGGIGSITYGQLRDRGNVNRVRVVTLEDEPRIIELKGDQTNQVNHAYGTNGIMTEIEIPLGICHDWVDIIVIFDDFMTSAKFGQALCDSDGMVKKLVSIHADPIPQYFTALNSYLPESKHCALLTMSKNSLLGLQELVTEYNGEITYTKELIASNSLNLLEFTWNHTTLHARNFDANWTYLQTFFFSLEQVQHMYEHFADEVIMHLEFLRVGGKAIPAGLQLVRFSTEERLNEIIQYHEDHGAMIANPHTYILEDGGRKVVEPEQLQFKQMVDPYGLINQGKMKAFIVSK